MKILKAKIFDTDYYVEVVSDLFRYWISEPLISNTEIITILMLGFPRDITEKIIKIVKNDNLKTKIYLLTLEYEIKKIFNRYVVYYKDESDLSEIFAYDLIDDYDRSYGEYKSYIDYDTDFSLDLDYSNQKNKNSRNKKSYCNYKQFIFLSDFKTLNNKYRDYNTIKIRFFQGYYRKDYKNYKSG